MDKCFSGGAKGSDCLWGKIAHELGHEVVQYSFRGHKTHCPPEDVVMLDQKDLTLADPWLLRANLILERTFPTESEYVNNLLRRNYWQIRTSNHVYAIADFDSASKYKCLKGGTAWAVQMAIEFNIPVTLYNPTDGIWYRSIMTGWMPLPLSDIETPSGHWTGIGQRTINNDIIRDVRKRILKRDDSTQARYHSG